MTIKKRDAQDHLEVCFSFPRECTNKINGCQFKCNRFELLKHLESCKFEIRCGYLECGEFFDGKEEYSEHLKEHLLQDSGKINNYCCSFPDCYFTSNDYFQYKKHRCVSHQFISSCCAKTCSSFEQFTDDKEFHLPDCHLKIQFVSFESVSCFDNFAKSNPKYKEIKKYSFINNKFRVIN